MSVYPFLVRHSALLFPKAPTNLFALAAAEVFSLPVPVGIGSASMGPLPNLDSEDPAPYTTENFAPRGLEPCDRIEISGFLVGTVTPVGKDLTLKLYRCPGANPLNRDTVPFATVVVAYSAAPAPAATLVTNGAFTTDLAGWNIGTRWFYNPSARAQLDTTGVGNERVRSELSQPVSLISQNMYLLVLGTLTPIPPTDVPQIHAFLGDQYVRSWAGLDAATFAGPTRKAALVRWDGETGSHLLRFQGSGMPIESDIDDIALHNVNTQVYRFSTIVERHDVGDALVVGFSPGADMANIYLTANYRRVTL